MNDKKNQMLMSQMLNCRRNQNNKDNGYNITITTPKRSIAQEQLDVDNRQLIAMTLDTDKLIINKYEELKVIKEKDDGQTMSVDSPTLSLIDALNPKTSIETILSIQLINLHTMQNKLMGNVEKQAMHAQMDSCVGITNLVNSLTKISNASSHLVLTMKKLQEPNSESVKVNDVVVNKGGQAVVGNVTTTTNK